MKNAISREPEGFEQSNFDASFANLECTLTAIHYKIENFKLGFQVFFEKKIKNNKKRHLEKDSSSKIWNQICNP